MSRDRKRAAEAASGAVLLSSGAPLIRRGGTVTGMSADVLLALAPATVWGVVLFGARAAVILLLSLLTALLCDALVPLLCRRPVCLRDGTAAVTGLLVGLSLPSAVPLWLPVVGAAFGVLVVKQLFGGLGRNLLNPALAGRLFLTLCFPAQLSLSVAPAVHLPLLLEKADPDVLSAATPLGTILSGELDRFSFFDLFVGRTGGAIGEVSALLLLAGGVYLLCRRVIPWEIPLSFLGAFSLLTVCFPLAARADAGKFLLESLLSGGLLLAVFFLACDPVTTPMSRAGRCLFGAGCGILTVVLRYFGSGTEGVCCAILLMNLLAHPLDRLAASVHFGGKRHEQ